jgi:hypothetical protein
VRQYATRLAAARQELDAPAWEAAWAAGAAMSADEAISYALI